MKQIPSRRSFLTAILGVSALAMVPLPAFAAVDDYVRFNFFRKKGTNFPYKLSEQEWRKKLGDESYMIVREGDNETAGTSPLLRERRKGRYLCKGCGQPIFSSTAKTMSNDYPTFRSVLNRKLIGLSTDFGIILPRTEIHCANCGGHLGYRFATEAPAAETWYYAVNGLSLTFQPS